jgi:hypothetical protein
MKLSLLPGGPVAGCPSFAVSLGGSDPTLTTSKKSFLLAISGGIVFRWALLFSSNLYTNSNIVFLANYHIGKNMLVSSQLSH